ncbi:haloacid dehalogenase-like hydrolase [Luteibacter yeojuensis]|uniref:Haloacid dehalogenase-like hydrolase n=1 Tax=Luteibacter yeojuensis TaxID=345309 RepID=A0A7X5QVD0_9GAMM|nr:haloacid dehalogenase-like hydrolase [Luteibacter yeojuensis]NID16117.1 haloacid dehalogenase-like hydrolase [Luteibacter yeojuensis]
MDQGMDAAVVEDTAAGARRVVLFDFDGVIVRHQTLELFYRQRLSGLGRWRVLLALPLVPFVPVLIGSVAGNRFLGRVFLRVVTFGRSEAGCRRLMNAFGRTYARRPGVFCRDAVVTLRRHVDAGDRVVIVTGNEQEMVEAMLDEVNLGGCELVASQARMGLFGMRFVNHNVHHAKVRTLDRAGIPRPWAVAYGDSLSDVPMLKAADAARLVNPSPKTLKKASRLLAGKLEAVYWY